MLLERLKLWTGIASVEEDGRRSNQVLQHAIAGARTALAEVSYQSGRVAQMAARVAIIENRPQDQQKQEIEENVVRGDN
jgi:hypothetical protein